MKWNSEEEDIVGECTDPGGGRSGRRRGDGRLLQHRLRVLWHNTSLHHANFSYLAIYTYIWLMK